MFPLGLEARTLFGRTSDSRVGFGFQLRVWGREGEIRRRFGERGRGGMDNYMEDEMWALCSFLFIVPSML